MSISILVDSPKQVTIFQTYAPEFDLNKDLLNKKEITDFINEVRGGIKKGASGARQDNALDIVEKVRVGAESEVEINEGNKIAEIQKKDSLKGLKDIDVKGYSDEIKEIKDSRINEAENAIDRINTINRVPTLKRIRIPRITEVLERKEERIQELATERAGEFPKESVLDNFRSVRSFADVFDLSIDNAEKILTEKDINFSGNKIIKPEK